MLTLEVIETIDRLDEFRPEWSRFVQKTPPATPFQMPEWLITWWAHFGSGALRVMAFRESGELVGILPCFLHHWERRRQLTLLGSGVSDYLDPVFEPRCIDGILELVRTQLKTWADWDICDWQDLSMDTPLHALGPALPDTPCSAVPIDQPFEKFLADRPKELRRNLRRYREKAEAAGCLSFQVAETAPRELMDALVELHAARWSKAGESGMIQANRSEAFLRELVTLFEARGWLRFFALRFRDEVAAIILAWCNQTAIFGYLSAFHPDYEKFGFGSQLLARALRYAHDRGYRQWNFLRGAEPYKFSWGAQVTAKRRVVISR